eukprot:5792955-Lingulodinium_polyedra.AAC.1
MVCAICGFPGRSLCVALPSPGYALDDRADNQAMLRCNETGRNPAMRYLPPTHRVSVARLHERFPDPCAQLQVL